MQCTACEVPLTGGLDTFGEINQPLCQECFLAFSQPERSRIIHTIELDAAGRIITEGIKIQYVAIEEES